ncbi:TPA: pheST operon leader peptide PheM [Yersinia enterocolitica]
MMHAVTFRFFFYFSS